MDFFNTCKDETEVKSLFRKLCKHFHPDHDGDSDLMIELKKQYDDWQPAQSGRKYEKFGESISEEQKRYYSGFAYSINPRVEILEAELARLRNMLKDSPTTMQNQRERIAMLNQELIKYRGINAHKTIYLARKDAEILQLKGRIEELEKVAIVKEETTDTLWNKIKFVMGCNPKKRYK